MIRTRFAPSPTGDLHIGGARTALFNWLYAKKFGGEFVLRIEDTDESRNTQKSLNSLLNSLNWLGLNWDRGPQNDQPNQYFQSQRRSIYDQYFQKLQNQDLVYLDDGAWRFRFQRKPITFEDLICGELTIDYTNTSNTPDMVIRRTNGSYVFHFVNVVDDLEMQITHVIRGEDHLMNTPKHLQLFEAFGATSPQYAHLPLIFNANASKMSKRDANSGLNGYIEEGYLPQAFNNFIALLGWSDKQEREILSIAELIEAFELNQINRSPAQFNAEKCLWLNQQHLLALDIDEFSLLAQNVIEKVNLPIPENFNEIAQCIQSKIKTLSEIPNASAYLLGDRYAIDQKSAQKIDASLLPSLIENWKNLIDWKQAKPAILELAKASGSKPAPLMMATRFALSGKLGGPDLEVILALLGKETCLKRLEQLATSS